MAFFLVLNTNNFFKTARGKLGGSGRVYSLSRQICIVSSSGTLVKSDVIFKEHIKPLLCLYCLAQSAKLKESFIVYWSVEIGRSMYVNKEGGKL